MTSEVDFKVTKQPKMVRTKISLKILPGIQKSILKFFKSKKQRNIGQQMTLMAVNQIFYFQILIDI